MTNVAFMFSEKIRDNVRYCIRSTIYNQVGFYNVMDVVDDELLPIRMCITVGDEIEFNLKINK